MNCIKIFFNLYIMLLFISCTTEIISESNSSSSIFAIYGDSVIYVGEIYQTVKIGEQVWLARNLNHNAEGSKCYNNIPNYYCEKYGRLYNWATAMNLPKKCNDILSTDDVDCTIDTPHQGLCPSGWHIPTNADWDKLMYFIDGNTGTSSPYSSPVAGRYLKDQYGWNNCGLIGSGIEHYPNGEYYICEDKYGFAALPGGFGNSDGDFGNAGSDGYWWSASESSSNGVYDYYMISTLDSVRWNGNTSKNNLLSVRCVKISSDGSSSIESSSSSLSSSNSSASVVSIVVPGNSLADKLNWLSNTNFIVEINANESLAPQALSYNAKNNITITLRGGTGISRTIGLSSKGSMFSIGSGVTLILDGNITLQGRSNNNTSLVEVNFEGSLIMNAGSRITNNTAFFGGGVYIGENGTFTMNGDSVLNNSA